MAETKMRRTLSASILGLAILIPIVSGCRTGPDESADLRSPDGIAPQAEYVGREACIDCHRQQSELFIGSDHDLAMDRATEETVLGDFNDAVFELHGITSRFFKRNGRFFVNTEGEDGLMRDFEVEYVFGVRPLQQYLIGFPGGAYQCLPLCWDTRPEEDGGQHWFHIYGDERIRPDDVLFWTRITQNWNYMCAECHSTRVRKGFDRFREVYETTWSEIDVSCEACHGPGSEHVNWAEAADRGQPYPTQGYLGLALRLKDTDGATWVFRDLQKGTAERTVARAARRVVETCARCHARRTSIHEEYVHGRSFMDTHWPSVLEEGLYFPDGQILDEVYVYGSFLQSKMYMAGVSCKDCHEPHSGRVFVQGNALCFRCHLPEKYGGREHHFHKNESTGALCVECHMVERTYMVVDPRRDHSMRVPRPDLSDRLGTPNACIRCHDHRDKSNRWAADATRKWYGELQEGLTHYGEVFYAGRHGYPDARAGLLALASDGRMAPMIRATGLDLLARYPSQETLAVLRKGVYDGDPLIRMSAVQGFEMMGVDQRLAEIKHLLHDPVRLVRVRTAFLLAGADRAGMTGPEREWLESALEEYRQVQFFNADHPSAHLNLGVLAALEGRPEEAEAAYRKAMAIEPLLPFTYLNLADLYRSLGRDGEGERVLRRGLELIPDSADLYHALGLLHVRRKETGKALTALKRAADLDPDNPRFAYVYGVGLNSQGRSREALTVLREALDRHPFDRDLLYALATICRDLERYPEALEYAERLVETSPQVPEFRQLERLLRDSLKRPRLP
jgi:tetratricopeptide (TPR) repeat protein